MKPPQSPPQPGSSTVAAVPEQRGAGLIADTLVSLGVTTVFCYPGGANLEMLDALSRADIKLLRTEHEQGAVFAAQGYARATGRLGVCVATSGPGATNLVTGIADAMSDSIPILCITGNVATRWLGRNAFQEVDIVSITRPVTKLARQVRAVGEIVAALRAAASTALGGRPGPVLLDFPKDIQQLPASASASGESDAVAVKSKVATDVATDVATGTDALAAASLGSAALAEIAELLATSQRPVIYAGGGVIAAGQHELLTRLAATLNCPVVLTLMGLGAMDPAHPLCLGPLGMHGAWCANVAVNEADLVFALGVRFDDRVIGDPATFAHKAKIVHIDVDPRELGKNRAVHLGLQADLRTALPWLLHLARPLPSGAWLDYLAAVAREHPLRANLEDAQLNGPQAIAMLSAVLPANAIVTLGVGQHQMWAMQHLKARKARGFLSSSGFGTMGFGLPAAIGAKQGIPAATVIDIDGDGSLNMTINELSTCRRYRLGVKVFVVNNQWLGMVRQWQDMIYAGNRVTSSLQDPLSAVAPAGSAAPYPDFLAIARGYRIGAERVERAAQLPAALARLLADPDEPLLLDVMVEREHNVLPMIPAGKSYREVVFEAGAAGKIDT